MQVHGNLLVQRFDRPVDLLTIHRAVPDRFPFLLESTACGTPQSRWSLLLGLPGARLELDADGLHLDGLDLDNGFTEALDAWWEKECTARSPELDLPFRGGWFLYLGYELAGEIEPVLELPPPPEAMPTAVAVRCRAALINDHETGCAWLVAEAQAAGQLSDIAAALGTAPATEHVPRRSGSAANVLEESPTSTRGRAAPAGARLPLAAEAACEIQEDDPQRFLDGVVRIRDYIRDGDVFQVNLSRAWQADLEPGRDDAALYERLRETNPAPFAGLAAFGHWSIVSSSPERLVRVHEDMIETRPIAGTRPRGSDEAGDAALSHELMAHPKERAEHIMLIDLERNDLGRICEPGSVTVDEFMTVESYAHVHHIVSNVRGRLREGVTPGEIIRAVFPGGTITGCPKVRCMEIIAELEGEGRGAYTGSMGYLNRDGDLDLNILIRSFQRHGDRLRLRAGAGIVTDSDPGRELDETRHKAAGLLRALGR